MTIDIVSIVENISQSLLQVQNLMRGAAYMMGIVFIMIALFKLKQRHQSRGQSEEKLSSPMGYLLAGAALLFFPSMMLVMSTSVFGVTNPLQYTRFSSANIFSAIGIMLQTAGVVWFVRGCTLLVHGGEPGDKHAKKGFFFLCAGVLAMNYASLAGVLNYIMLGLINWMKPK
jgi:hypothetical protein